LTYLLSRVVFHSHTDVLISLGNVVDCGPQPIEVVETLMKISNIVEKTLKKSISGGLL
jgi:hypothetical protein